MKRRGNDENISSGNFCSYNEELFKPNLAETLYLKNVEFILKNNPD